MPPPPPSGEIAVNRSATGDAIKTVSLVVKGKFVKTSKVSKYYENDCSPNDSND